MCATTATSATNFPHFQPWTIALIVAAFVLFWPLGLFLLLWIKSGRELRWPRLRRTGAPERETGHLVPTGNSAFDDFVDAERVRLRRETDELSRTAEDFDTYRAERKRDADESELLRFKAARG